MFLFEKLRVYQDALELVDEIYKLTKKWPIEERFGITDQIRRASVSTVLNIAEGSSRTKKDFAHFLDMARGSCYECVAALSISRKRLYISNEENQKMYDKLNELSRSLNALKKSIS